MKNLTYAVTFSWVIILSGCYTSTAVVHQESGQTELLAITETQHGYTLGPCGIVDPGIWSKAEVKLEGKKDKYSDGEYTVNYPTEYFKIGPFAPRLSGTITVDWKKHEVRVELEEWSDEQPDRHPSRINGTFSFKEEKGPNQ